MDSSNAGIESRCLVYRSSTRTLQPPPVAPGTQATNLTFGCSRCPQSFLSLDELQVHILTAHVFNSGQSTGQCICNKCHSAFRCRADLDNHNRLHSSQTPYRCSVCSTAYANLEELTSHFESQHSWAPHVYDKCHENRRVQRQTCSEALPDASVLGVHNVLTFRGVRQCSTCPYCSKAFKNDACLMQHTNRAHKKSKPYGKHHLLCKCHLCDKEFTELIGRSAKHSNQIAPSTDSTVCCDSEAASNDMMASSNQPNAADIKQCSTCPYCRKSFKNDAYLMQHTDKAHSLHKKLKQYRKHHLLCKCHLCDKKFTEVLIGSEKHSNQIAPYTDSTVCCDSEAASNDMMASSNQPNAADIKQCSTCPYCRKSFKNDAYLMQHTDKAHSLHKKLKQYRKHHPLCKCHLCTKKFTERIDSAKHSSNQIAPSTDSTVCCDSEAASNDTMALASSSQPNTAEMSVRNDVSTNLSLPCAMVPDEIETLGTACSSHSARLPAGSQIRRLLNAPPLSAPRRSTVGKAWIREFAGFIQKIPWYNGTLKVRHPFQLIPNSTRVTRHDPVSLLSHNPSDSRNDGNASKKMRKRRHSNIIRVLSSEISTQNVVCLTDSSHGRKRGTASKRMLQPVHENSVTVTVSGGISMPGEMVCSMDNMPSYATGKVQEEEGNSRLVSVVGYPHGDASMFARPKPVAQFVTASALGQKPNETHENNQSNTGGPHDPHCTTTTADGDGRQQMDCPIAGGFDNAAISRHAESMHGARLLVYPLKLSEMCHVTLVNACSRSQEFSVSFVHSDACTPASMLIGCAVLNFSLSSEACEVITALKSIRDDLSIRWLQPDDDIKTVIQSLKSEIVDPVVMIDVPRTSTKTEPSREDAATQPVADASLRISRTSADSSRLNLPQECVLSSGDHTQNIHVQSTADSTGVDNARNRNFVDVTPSSVSHPNSLHDRHDNIYVSPASCYDGLVTSDGLLAGSTRLALRSHSDQPAPVTSGRSTNTYSHTSGGPNIATGNTPSTWAVDTEAEDALVAVVKLENFPSCPAEDTDWRLSDIDGVDFDFREILADMNIGSSEVTESRSLLGACLESQNPRNNQYDVFRVRPRSRGSSRSSRSADRSFYLPTEQTNSNRNMEQVSVLTDGSSSYPHPNSTQSAFCAPFSHSCHESGAMATEPASSLLANTSYGTIITDTMFVNGTPTSFQQTVPSGNSSHIHSSPVTSLGFSAAASECARLSHPLPALNFGTSDAMIPFPSPASSNQTHPLNRESLPVTGSHNPYATAGTTWLTSMAQTGNGLTYSSGMLPDIVSAAMPAVSFRAASLPSGVPMLGGNSLPDSYPGSHLQLPFPTPNQTFHQSPTVDGSAYNQRFGGTSSSLSSMPLFGGSSVPDNCPSSRLQLPFPPPNQAFHLSPTIYGSGYNPRFGGSSVPDNCPSSRLQLPFPPPNQAFHPSPTVYGSGYTPRFGGTSSSLSSVPLFGGSSVPDSCTHPSSLQPVPPDPALNPFPTISGSTGCNPDFTGTTGNLSSVQPFSENSMSDLLAGLDRQFLQLQQQMNQQQQTQQLQELYLAAQQQQQQQQQQRPPLVDQQQQQILQLYQAIQVAVNAGQTAGSTATPMVTAVDISDDDSDIEIIEHRDNRLTVSVSNTTNTVTVDDDDDDECCDVDVNKKDVEVGSSSSDDAISSGSDGESAYPRTVADFISSDIKLQMRPVVVIRERANIKAETQHVDDSEDAANNHDVIPDAPEPPKQPDTCSLSEEQQQPTSADLPVKMYVCRTCGRKFKSPVQVRYHGCYQKSGDTNQTEGKRPKGDRKPLTCPHCGKCFKLRCFLKQHITVHTGEKPYSCDTCSKNFRLAAQLVRHKKVHSGEKPYPCPTCGKRFMDQYYLNFHQTIHSGQKMYTCKLCDKAFYNSLQLWHHMRRHRISKLHACQSCGRSFTSQYQLTAHIGSDGRCKGKCVSDKKPLACQHCGKCFRYGSQLTLHIRLHTGEKPYSCQTCGKRFRERYVFNAHRAIHSGQKLFTCKLCDKAFYSSLHLWHHMRRHRISKPHACQSCGRSFISQRQLTAHVGRTGNCKEKCVSDKNSLTCHHCGKCCRNPSFLIQHIRIHTGEKPYSCGTCGKNFRLAAQLVSHTGVHSGEKKYSCQTCGKRFRLQNNFRAHQKIHSGLKPYICHMCDKAFCSASQLCSHMRRHRISKSHACNRCGRSFTSRYLLTAHLGPAGDCKKKRTNDKNALTCHQCGKCFRRPYLLARHITIHTGERPYSCGTCGKNFRLATLLTAHNRLHTGENPYRCGICHERFRWSSQFYKHKQIHTTPKLYKCVQCDKAFSYKFQLLKHVTNHKTPTSDAGQQILAIDESSRECSDKSKGDEKAQNCQHCGKYFKFAAVCLCA